MKANEIHPRHQTPIFLELEGKANVHVNWTLAHTHLKRSFGDTLLTFCPFPFAYKTPTNQALGKNSFLFADSTKKIPKMFDIQDSILPLMDIGRGDSSRTRSFYQLPPGCRFFPSEEQLLNHYLTGKISSPASDRADVYCYDLIREINLYDYQPSDLPEGACFMHGHRGRKRHWFCYTESKGGRRRRRAKGGFWKKVGKVRDVFDGRNVLLGTRTKFVFYEVNSVKAAVRTPWIMHEYALLHHYKASFVLCRVFFKSHAGNSVLENVLSSRAEESVSAACLIGIQHKDFLTPEIVEAKINCDDFAKELDDPIRPISVSRFEFPSGTPSDLPNDRVGSQLTATELLSIVEEDFIELDDLRQ